MFSEADGPMAGPIRSVEGMCARTRTFLQRFNCWGSFLATLGVRQWRTTLENVAKKTHDIDSSM